MTQHEIREADLRGYGCTQNGTLLYFWRASEGKEIRFVHKITDLMDISEDAETLSLRLDFRTGDSLVIHEMHPVALLNHVKSLKRYVHVYMYQG